MFLTDLVPAGRQGQSGLIDGVHWEGFALQLGLSFSVLWLLMCSDVVVADRKANKGTGGWEMPGLEQGGDMWAGTAVSLISATTHAQHSRGSTWGSSRSPRELYQLHFSFRLGC